MGVEIERKFLVNREKWLKVKPLEGVFIAQGYLLNERDRSVRIRVKGDKGFLTIKGGEDGLKRTEYEYPIPRSEALEIIEKFELTTIQKVRYELEVEGYIWEIDEFQQPKNDLILAELELPEKNTTFSLPEWVEEEVTNNPNYYNAEMLR